MHSKLHPDLSSDMPIPWEVSVSALIISLQPSQPVGGAQFKI